MIALPSALFVHALLLAQALPSPNVQATWPAEFYAGATGAHFGQGPSYAGWQASGSLSATWFVRRPLVDDGTPLGIQSYLQRLSTLAFSCGGLALSASDSASPYRYASESMYASPSGFFYLGDVILGAGAYFYRVGSATQPADFSAEQHHSTTLVYPWASAGLRSDNFEIYGSYRYRTYFDDGTRRPATWGQANVRLRNTVDNAFYWRLDGYTLTGGAGGAFDVEVFFGPMVGVWLDGYFEAGQMYVNSSDAYSRQGAELGAGWWASPRFELQFSLGIGSASRNDSSAPASTTTSVTFGVVLRAPQYIRTQPASEPPPPSVVVPKPPQTSPSPPERTPAPVESPPPAGSPAPPAPPAPQELPAPPAPPTPPI